MKEIMINDSYCTFRCSNGLWVFYAAIDMQQLVKILMSSNNILKQEVWNLKEARQWRIMLRLKAPALVCESTHVIVTLPH